MAKTLIGMRVFGGEGTPTVLCILNWGDKLEDGKIRYETKDRTLEKDIPHFSKIDRGVFSCEFDELDLSASLYDWHRLTRYAHQHKKVTIDYDFEGGERYHPQSWHLPVMLKPTDDAILIKPIFD
jgi:hypothetical protein